MSDSSCPKPRTTLRLAILVFVVLYAATATITAATAFLAGGFDGLVVLALLGAPVLVVLVGRRLWGLLTGHPLLYGLFESRR